VQDIAVSSKSSARTPVVQVHVGATKHVALSSANLTSVASFFGSKATGQTPPKSAAAADAAQGERESAICAPRTASHAQAAMPALTDLEDAARSGADLRQTGQAVNDIAHAAVQRSEHAAQKMGQRTRTDALPPVHVHACGVVPFRAPNAEHFLQHQQPDVQQDFVDPSSVPGVAQHVSCEGATSVDIVSVLHGVQAGLLDAKDILTISKALHLAQ
jgi:hypothetical protein